MNNDKKILDFHREQMKNIFDSIMGMEKGSELKGYWDNITITPQAERDYKLGNDTVEER